MPTDKQCERCNRKGKATAVTVSSVNNTTMVWLCESCLKSLRLLWQTFMDPRFAKHDKSEGTGDTDVRAPS